MSERSGAAIAASTMARARTGCPCMQVRTSSSNRSVEVGVAAAASRLGRPFRVDSGENAFIRRLREAYGAYNISVGAERFAEIPE